MGDRDAAGQAGGRGRLAGQRVVDELVDVGGAAGVADDAGEGADHVVLVGAEGGVEAHEVGVISSVMRLTSSGEVEATHRDQVGVDLRGVGDGGAGQAGGGAAVGDGEREPLGRAVRRATSPRR